MLKKLLDCIDKSNTKVDKEFVTKAYNFAYEAHKNQRRESGEPYVLHPVEVACILADMGMDTTTVTAGLLHDVIEDTSYTHEDLEKMFSKEVADLVEGVTKLDKIESKTKEEEQADNVRKMLLAMSDDLRVILIKLADRLHNMRTLKFMSVKKQKIKAKETFDIYAPLAHRLGMSKLKWELEDLAFRYENPNEYYFLVRKIAEKRQEREDYIHEIIRTVKQSLDSSGISSEIDGRPKHLYSIHRKMVNKNKSIDEIFDLTAVRIMVDSVKDCYAALGIVHTLYKPLPGRFKDYIAMPKPNMYQSLHSTVIGPQGKPFEIQIRTLDMHRTAEYGVAAHWKYKEGITGDESDSDKDVDIKLTWLRDIIDWQKETSDASEFMEGFKVDLFSDEVFVFTPKGNVINLPHDATPIDFAYKIHTDIGNRCVGSKVNGKMVPLDYKLSTGEIVEIISSPLAKGPNMDWINMAKSNQAKSKIRSWFKKAKREENIAKGKEYLEREAKKQSCNFGEVAKGEALNQIFKKYNLFNIDDLYAAVGMNGMISGMIVSRLKEASEKGKEELKDWKEIEEEANKAAAAASAKAKANQKQPGIIVKGESNLLVRFAMCCNPVPGDDIVGYITKGRGVSIHRRDCKNVDHAMKNEDNRFVEVSWGTPKGAEYVAEFQIKTEERDGLLSEVMALISNSKTHLYAINAKPNKSGISYIDIKLKIVTVDDL
ncbi:MAG TPA: bifunctional (p)ppGpp synthetase/guanosine-3',5'-bis(diphosphate) 3'-pyrophosphohydrolase, partial [Clostridiaceae bacterium]